VPAVVGRLRAAGLDVVVETEAGLGALIPDALYEQAGARLGDPWSADVVVKVTPPTPDEIGKLRSGAVLIGFLAPLTSPDTITALRSAGVTGFAMESIPRISRAQSMDALSSQANVAGYKAVILAAEQSTRFFPMPHHRRRHRQARHRPCPRRRRTPACRRWRPRGASALAPRATTCAPK